MAKKKKKDAIQQRTHRGKPALRYYVGTTARYRVIDTTRDVDEQIDELWDEIRAGGGRPKRAKTRSQILAFWHKDMLAKAGGTANTKQAQQTLRRVQRTHTEAGIAELTDISVAKIRTTVADLKMANSDRPLSEQTKQHYAKANKQFTRWCSIEGYMPADTLATWHVSEVTVERHPRDRLQPDELALLIETTRKSTVVILGYSGEERAWLYRLAAYTGFRRSELAALTDRSFDWTTRTVVVPGKFTKNGKPAVLPIHKNLNGELRDWVENRPGVLFPDLREKPLHRMIKRDLKRAGIAYQTEVGSRCFHGLRNTFISSLFDVTDNVDTIRTLARHNSVRTTMRYAKPKSNATAIIDEIDCPLVHDRVQAEE